MAIISVMASCSSSKFIPEEHYLLDKVEIRSDEKDFNASQLASFIRQKANSRWFSLFKIPLGTYSAAGRDTTKWLNRTLQRIGEEPVIYDSVQARISCEDLKRAMQNMGYMGATVDIDTKVKGHKLTAIYTLHPNVPYFINSISYNIADKNIEAILNNGGLDRSKLHSGTRFSVNDLDEERKRISAMLTDRGYYKFNKDFITYSADSVKGQKGIDLTMHLHRYRATNDSEETDHACYNIGQVNFTGGDTTGLHIRGSVLRNKCLIREGQAFSATDLKNTYNNFGRLGAVRYTNIQFREVPDTNLLDCYIQIAA